MTSILVQFYLLAEPAEDPKTTVLRVKRVRLVGSEVWYGFPYELQTPAKHSKLFAAGPMKVAKDAIKTRGQYRAVNVKLTEEMQTLYLDEAGNFVFEGHFLAESEDLLQSSSLVSIAPAAQPRQESLKDIMQHFLVEKLSSKNSNIVAWADAFEKEINRFKISGAKIIEVFRLCLDESLNDWFLATQRKIGLEANWSSWRADLVQTFGDVSWRPIRYAFNFKFMGGSLVDYVVRKERLLLDLDYEIPDQVKLDLIVLGLPVHIQDSMNRSAVSSLKLLIAKLKKFEVFSTASGRKAVGKSEGLEELKKGSTPNYSFIKKPSVEKKPCQICQKAGKGTKYHAERVCWFREDKEKSKVNLVNNIELEGELNTHNIVPKNE